MQKTGQDDQDHEGPGKIKQDRDWPPQKKPAAGRRTKATGGGEGGKSKAQEEGGREEGGQGARQGGHKITRRPRAKSATKARKAAAGQGVRWRSCRSLPSRPVLSEVVGPQPPQSRPWPRAITLDWLRIQFIEELAAHERQAEGPAGRGRGLANEREPGHNQFDEESGEGDTVSVERERDLAL